ncbi:MAG: hypothetical protein ABSA06_15765 [Geobacteraceae bacterium]|jgi:hypothetical protein
MDIENRREGVALATADVGVKTGTIGLLTERGHLDTTPEPSRRRPVYFGTQFHERAGIRLEDRWDRAGPAQITAPGRTDQAAFFMLTTAVVVTVKIGAFGPGRCLHRWDK